MNVLVIAPHPDDEVLGCGGTLCRHAENGDRVAVVFLTSGELGLKNLSRDKAWLIREGEARAAGKILGVGTIEFLRGPDWGIAEAIPTLADSLRAILLREPPGLVYLPHPRDGHPDHQTTLPLLRAAWPTSNVRPPELRAYEVWTPLAEHDHVADISPFMPRKLRALRAHRSQLGGSFDYVRAIRGLNQYRGALAGRCQFAEVFQSLLLEDHR